jgi:hypothetical protein
MTKEEYFKALEDGEVERASTILMAIGNEDADLASEVWIEGLQDKSLKRECLKLKVIPEFVTFIRELYTRE